MNMKLALALAAGFVAGWVLSRRYAPRVVTPGGAAPNPWLFANQPAIR